MKKQLPITIENGKRLFDIEIFNGAEKTPNILIRCSPAA